MGYNFQKHLNVYEKTVELPSSGEEVKIKPITTNQMKKLLVYENESDPIMGEVILDEILNFSLIDRDVKDLILQDRYYLFVEIRKLTKGTSHTYSTDCPKCKSPNIQTIDLNKLIVNKPNKEADKFVTVLNGELKLNLEFPTRGLQIEGYNQIDPKLSPSEKQVEMILANLAQSIVSIESSTGIDENIPVKDKMKFVGDLPGIDYDTIKNWFDENDFGIDLVIETKCQYCKFTNKHTLPLTNFFQ